MAAHNLGFSWGEHIIEFLTSQNFIPVSQERVADNELIYLVLGALHWPCLSPGP